MDIHFSEQDLAFRDEVRQWLSENWTAEHAAEIRDRKKFKKSIVAWEKRLANKGWIAPGWPEEHGGTGWTPTQKYIFETERAAAGAPDVTPFGVKMVAPVIYTFGSEEQKAQHLPKIYNADIWWCQGYSEPGSGSDLASLKTRADRDGDDYIINGAKIWTTYAQYADWIFCLVRTSNEGKAQSGISFLLIDMNTPGIQVNPIHSIDGVHSLNEVTFDDVRVPVSNRIGEENKGWTYAKALLAHERTAIAGVADSKLTLETIRDVASQEVNGGERLIDQPSFQQRFADIEIELMALEYTELRVLASDAAGKGPGVESSLLKLKGTELQQATQRLLLDCAGYYAGVEDTDNAIGHAFADEARRSYMYGRAATIYGGSNEVQKNITAKFVLGLK